MPKSSPISGVAPQYLNNLVVPVSLSHCLIDSELLFTVERLETTEKIAIAVYVLLVVNLGPSLESGQFSFLYTVGIR